MGHPTNEVQSGTPPCSGRGAVLCFVSPHNLVINVCLLVAADLFRSPVWRPVTVHSTVTVSDSSTNISILFAWLYSWYTRRRSFDIVESELLAGLRGRHRLSRSRCSRLVARLSRISSDRPSDELAQFGLMMPEEEARRYLYCPKPSCSVTVPPLDRPHRRQYRQKEPYQWTPCRST